MTTKTHENSRAHYRLVYPVGDRPTFTCLGQTMEVIDVSERGLAVTSPQQSLVSKSETQLNGKIVFSDGDSVAVTGKVLRTTGDTVILLLSKGVPLPIIIKQQRLMIQKYGTLRT